MTKNAPMHVVPEIFCSEKSLELIGHACPLPKVIVTLTVVAQADTKIGASANLSAGRTERVDSRYR